MFNYFSKKPKMSTTSIIMAAGSGTRMEMSENKLLVSLLDKPLIAHTLHAFEETEIIEDIIIVTREQDILNMWDICAAFEITKVRSIIKGGETRQQSVSLGLLEAKDAEYVAIHDGARPCITPEQITKTVMAAEKHGAAAIGCKVSDSLKQVENGIILHTINREKLYQVQTPQVFQYDIIAKAHKAAMEQGISVTDDTALLEALGIPVHMVEGSQANIKVTTKTDIVIAQSILGGLEYNGY